MTKTKILLFASGILTLTIALIIAFNPHLINSIQQHFQPESEKLSGPEIDTPWGTVTLAPIQTKDPQCLNKPTNLTQIAYSIDEGKNNTSTIATYYTNGDQIETLTKYYKNKFNECGYIFIQSNNETPTKDLTSIKHLYFKKSEGGKTYNADLTLTTAEKNNNIYTLALLRLNAYVQSNVSNDSLETQNLDFNKISNKRPQLPISIQYNQIILSVLTEIFKGAKLYREEGISHNAQLVYVIKDTPRKTDLTKLRTTLEKHNFTIKSAKITPCGLLSVHAIDQANHIIINPGIGKHAVYVYIYKE